MLRSWPVSGIRLTTPVVEMRWPSMEDLDELALRGAVGVHDPGYMPFFSGWTDGDAETVAYRVIQRHWAALGAWKPQEWTLFLAIVHDGQVVGSQSMGGRNFAACREVVLTSWIGREFQGKGLGKHARAAMLHLAFEGLGADYAFVVVRQDNLPSQGVCKRMGFVADGTQINAVRGQQVISDRFRLDRQGWLANREVDVEMTGVRESYRLFGLDGSTTSPAGLVEPDVALLSGVQWAPDPDESQ